MASSVILSTNSPDPSLSVDLSNLGVTVSYRMSNPLVSMAVPKKLGSSPNTYTINLVMINRNADLTFTLTDGCGTWNFETPGSTNFEKLSCMAQTPKYKNFIINGSSIPCQITAFNTNIEPGRKDLLVGCRMSLVLFVKR